MQSKMINSVLKSNWNSYKNSFDVDLSSVDTYGINLHYDFNHYLFLKRELGVTADNWAEAKRNGLIRHAKLYRGKFLDYVVHKEFDTIEEWVKDAGGKMEDVLYGENRVKNKAWNWHADRGAYVHTHCKAKYVPLSVLLERLGYVAPPVVDTTTTADVPTTTTQDLTDMISLEMRMRGLSIGRVFVLNEANTLVSWTNFITQ
jgi:hypothetical protein